VPGLPVGNVGLIIKTLLNALQINIKVLSLPPQIKEIPLL
jgi:hypothetical protein